MSVEDLLKSLAESDRNLEARPAVEAQLRSAFKRKYSRRTWPYFALAAAAAVVFTISIPRKPAETMKIAVAAPSVAVVPLPRPAPPKVFHPQQPKEVVTEFYSLMDVQPQFDGGSLLRVSLPASAMRTVGLPVSEDHQSDLVQADVLVGEEGLARAIRFVRYE
jgi:hypothetical protein